MKQTARYRGCGTGVASEQHFLRAKELAPGRCRRGVWKTLGKAGIFFRAEGRGGASDKNVSTNVKSQGPKSRARGGAACL